MKKQAFLKIKMAETKRPKKKKKKKCFIVVKQLGFYSINDILSNIRTLSH